MAATSMLFPLRLPPRTTCKHGGSQRALFTAAFTTHLLTQPLCQQNPAQRNIPALNLYLKPYTSSQKPPVLAWCEAVWASTGDF
jgi:hypothetical protein